MIYWGAGVAAEIGRSGRNQYIFLRLPGIVETKDESPRFISLAIR